IRIWVDSEPSADVAAGIYVYDNASQATVLGGAISTSGRATHGLFADGGIVRLDGVDISAGGPQASAVYLSNPYSADSGLVEISGGSLSSLQAALIQADGGIGEVVLNGPISLLPPSIGGRDLFVLVTDNG